MDLSNKNVVIVGLGRSALGATALLREHGAKVFLSDSGDSRAVQEWAAQAHALGAASELGGHRMDRFLAADLIVMSPGVPPNIPPIAAARDKGIPVIAEIELAARFCRAPILAVTGTNGKTTVTELLTAMARACGHNAVLAGNNKMSFSQAVLDHPDAGYFVLEVSSYQLETIDTFRPMVGAILNLTPDHLGRHGDMAGYAETKARLFMNQKPGDIAILNADDDVVSGLSTPDRVKRRFFSLSARPAEGVWSNGTAIRNGDEAIAAVSDCPLPGRHNLANALVALTIAEAAGFDSSRCLDALREFRGVEHRLELLATIDGVPYYNDSKSTNIDSLRVALESFTQPIVLIAGGEGKGASYDSLRDQVAGHVKHLVAIGEDAPKLIDTFGTTVSCERADSMDDAVQSAHAVVQAGDVVLLSPGCASFDMYSNFEERGEDFKACVRRLSEVAPAQAGESL